MIIFQAGYRQFLLDGRSEQNEHFCMVTLLNILNICTYILCLNKTLTVSNDNSSFRKFYIFTRIISAVDSHCKLFQSSITVWLKETKPGSLNVLMFSCIDQLRGGVRNKMQNTWTFVTPDEYEYLAYTNVICSNFVCAIEPLSRRIANMEGGKWDRGMCSCI